MFKIELGTSEEQRFYMKELERKAKKSIRWKSKLFTPEEIKFARVKAKIWADIFKYGRYEAVIECLQKLIQKKQKLLT
jgi:hypothetical protein